MRTHLRQVCILEKSQHLNFVNTGRVPSFPRGTQGLCSHSPVLRPPQTQVVPGLQMVRGDKEKSPTHKEDSLGTGPGIRKELI